MIVTSSHDMKQSAIRLTRGVTPVKERILGYRQRMKASDELEAVIVLLHGFPVCHRADVMP